MRLVSIILADGDKFRIINGGLDLAQCIYKRHHELSASYCEWEILKDWWL